MFHLARTEILLFLNATRPVRPTVGVARLLGPNSRSRGPSGLGIPTCYNPLGPQLDPTAVREHQATGQPRRETGATCGAIANPNEQ